MRASEKTARRDARTAGKTARNTKKQGVKSTWKTVRTKQGVALRSPEGRLYYGNPQEIRDIKMLPWVRKQLSDGVRYLRDYAARNAMSGEELRELVKELRRDAISSNHISKSVHGGDTGCDREILARACARYMGETYEEYINGCIDAAIEAAIEDAPGYTIPRTRYEKAALKSPLSKWAAVLRREKTEKEG